MQMVEVQSSQIAAVGHDGVSTLRIQFRPRGLYEYDNVTPEMHAEMLGSSSIGRFFGQYIKGQPAFPFRRVDEGSASVQERRVVLDAPLTVTELPAITGGELVQTVTAESGELSDQAKTIRVIDAQTQEIASGMLRDIAIMRGKVVSTWKPMKEAAFKAHRTICDQEKAVDAPLLEAETCLKREIGAYVAAERERAREEEARLAREARERAEAEAHAESERLALDDALQLEKDGFHEAAEAAIASPLPVAPRYIAPTPVVPQLARVSGVSTREVWKFRVVDESKVPRQYLQVNEKAIGGVVRAMGAKANIPGVEVYADTTVTARRA